MTELKKMLEWILSAIRATLLDGTNPRDAGGEDARAGRPPPQGDYLPAYLRNIETRGEALAHLADAEAREQFAEQIAELRNDPFSQDGATEQARAAPVKLAANIDNQIEHFGSQIRDRRAERDGAAIAYRHALQEARTKSPPGGWQSGWDLALWLAAAILIDGGLSAAMLKHALGLMSAVWTGLGMALIAVVGGLFAAHMLLRPTNHESNTLQRRRARWGLAALIAAFTLLLLYVGACFRAAWIDGQDGLSSELIEKFFSPEQVLINFDVLVLGFLGIAGFCLSALEYSNFYHGCDPLLRAAGLRLDRAEAALRDLADELKTFVRDSASAAVGDLEELEQASGAWVRAKAERADDAGGVGLEHSRRLDLIRRSVIGIAAEYLDGYFEVVAGDRCTPESSVVLGSDIAVPDVFQAARASAMAGARTVAEAIRQACLAISTVVSESIIRIDELAGLREKSPGTPSSPGKAIRP